MRPTPFYTTPLAKFIFIILTGHTTTGVIKIPKLKLMSGLSMRLGRNSDPYVANFRGVAYPDIGPNGKRVCDFYILPEDIDRNDIMI